MAASGGSLNLLQVYDSSESEDEQVPGPRVSTKRTLSKEWATEQSKKLCPTRLPLPAALSSMFPDEDNKPIDDPSLHDGRLRSFAHERGNWSTLVYLPCTDAIEPIESWNKLISIVMHWEVEDIRLSLIEDPHISLSRTVILRHHWIDSFLLDLRKQFQTMNKFSLYLSGFKVFVNDEKTRTFLAVPVYKGEENVHKLSEITDKVLAEFKLPPFYEEGSFHISIAWCLGDRKNILEESLEDLQEQVDTQHIPSLWPINVTKAHCKSGNKIHVLPLAT